MSELPALAQVIIGAATLLVAILALKRENPPEDGGNSNKHEG